MKPEEIEHYYGFYIGRSLDKVWKIECPCGNIVEYPLNGLPEVDTPMPCGNKNQWVIKFDEESRDSIKRRFLKTLNIK